MTVQISCGVAEASSAFPIVHVTLKRSVKYRTVKIPSQTKVNNKRKKEIHPEQSHPFPAPIEGVFKLL